MKRITLALCAVFVLATAAMAVDAPAPTATPLALPIAALKTPYAATLGDMIAVTMSQYGLVQKSREGWAGLDAPIVVTYDHAADKLVISLYGNVGSTPVDQARTTLESFRSRFLPVLSSAVASTYHVAIGENDITLVFCNRVTMKEVLRREDAKYFVADN